MAINERISSLVSEGLLFVDALCEEHSTHSDLVSFLH